MSVCTRGTYLALGWLVVAVVSPNEASAEGGYYRVETQQHTQSKEDTQHAQSPLPSGIRSENTQPKTDPGSYRNPCEKPETRDAADLCQQWRMANAAEETADWVFWQLWGTGAEIILLVLAVIFAGLAAHWAKHAAQETGKSADIDERALKNAKHSASQANQISAQAMATSEKMGRAQIRAYLNVFEIKAIWDENEFLALSMMCRNSGRTPAKRIKIVADCALGDIFQVKDHFIGERYEYVEDLGADDIRNVEVHVGQVGPEEVKDNFRNDSSYLKASIAIHYVDVFNEHITERASFWTRFDETANLFVGQHVMVIDPPNER